MVSRANQYDELHRAAPKLIEFSDMMAGLRRQAEELPADRLYDLVLEKTGYEKPCATRAETKTSPGWRTSPS